MFVMINWNERRGKVNGILFGVVMIGGFLACFLLHSEVIAVEIQKDILVTKVTETNFEEIQRRLKNDDPSITSLNLKFILEMKELEELKDIVENNTELGYILWHKDQAISEDLEKIEAKLKSNNQNYQYYPGDYMHGLLITHAYINAKVNDIVTLDELSLDENTKEKLKYWRVEKVHNSVQENGYYGVIYKNDKTHQIVLANRGTEEGAMDIMTNLFKQNSDWNTNLKEILIAQIIVGQQICNYEATEEAIKIAKELGYRLSFTGHSLGAWLAELSAFYSYDYFKFHNIKAVTFDSPGALPMMKKLQSNIQNRKTQVDFNDIDIVTYLTKTNPMNCCNEHMGKVYQVEVVLAWEDWIYDTLPIYVINSVGNAIQWFLAVEEHELRRIIETFDPATGKPKEYKRMADWPRLEYKGDPRVFFDQKDAFVNKILNGLNVLGSIDNVGGKIDPKIFNYIIGDEMLMPLIALLLNLSQIDQGQYWAYVKDFEEEHQTLDCRFELLGKAKYREDDDRYTLNLSKGNIDEYIYELHKSKEKLTQRKNLSRIDKTQLENLLEKFTIEESINDGKHQLIPNDNFDVENIRQEAKRLFSILPENIIESLSSNRNLIYESNDELILSDNIPLRATAYFIWMDDLQEELEISLSKRSVVVISGVGGIGKSTLAATYGRSAKQCGWQVRWIKGMQIEEEFLQLAQDMNITSDHLRPQEVRDLVYKDFAKLFHEQEVLLIFDNVEDNEKIKSYLMNLPGNVKVIITSRKDDLLEGIKSIKLQGFDKEQAILYVQKALDKDKKESEKLVKTIGVSPFRLSKAVTYLKNHDLMSIDEFLSEYETIKSRNNQNEEIYPEVELLFRDLKRQEAGQQSLIDKLLSCFFIDIDVDSWELLKYLAYLDSEGVSLKLIERITGEDKNELQESIKELEQLSLANVVVEGDQTKLKISHRILQDEIKKALIEEDRTQRRETLEDVIVPLNRGFPFVDEKPENWKDVAELVNHAKALIKEKDVSKARKEELLRKIGYFYYYVICDYKEAIRYWEEALNYQRRMYKKNHPKIANSLNDLGIACYALEGKENIHTALKYLEESLKLKRTLSPRKHPRVAASLNNIGIAYYALGEEDNIRKGLKYQEEALKILFPDNHPSIADLLNIESLAYEDLEFKHKENVFKLKDALFSSHQVGLPDLLNNLGDYYQALEGKENIRKELKYFEKSLKTKQSLSPANHLSVADSLYNLGNAYSKLGDQDKKLESYKQAYSIYSALFDNKDHAQIKAIKSYIESIQPQFFVKESLNELLQQEDCINGNKVGLECRWIISSRGVTNYNLIQLKQKIQDDILDHVVQAAQKYGWSYVDWSGIDWGVKGYLDKSYLKYKLAEFGNDNDNIELAQMLCFESMNLGIMKSQNQKKTYGLVEIFTKSNLELMKKVAVEHPEFFVDGSIVEACISAMPDDELFQKHIFEHVKYLGKEERKKLGLWKFR